MSQAIAFEARNIVQEAAGPVPAGKNIKWQLRAACRALGYPDGHWRIRAAWYGEAASWSAVALEELRARYRRWSEKQERLADAEERKLATVFEALASRLEGGSDAEFHQADVDALRAVVRRIGAKSQT